MRRAPKPPAVATATFRPDSRDGRLDYKIPREIAIDLFARGLISIDATNGGYMPRAGVEYNVKQHRV